MYTRLMLSYAKPKEYHLMYYNMVCGGLMKPSCNDLPDLSGMVGTNEDFALFSDTICDSFQGYVNVWEAGCGVPTATFAVEYWKHAYKQKDTSTFFGKTNISPPEGGKTHSFLAIPYVQGSVENGSPLVMFADLADDFVGFHVGISAIEFKV